MPPKRNTTGKKLRATLQDAEEILTSSGGHGMGIGTGQDLPANKP